MKRYYLGLFLAALLSLLTLTSCADQEPSGAGSSGTPRQAETLHMLTFTAQLNGTRSELHYWGDGKNTYYFFLPSGCGPEALEVRTQNGITLRKDGESETARVPFSDGETLVGIECDTVYLLGCYDENHYLYELPVIFMAGENNHSVFITTRSGSIAAVLENKAHKEKGSIVITDPLGSVAYAGKLSHIKGRGNGSWISFKKPFNIKLAEKTDLLGMGVSRKWCLINQEGDLSCVRNKLAYDLAKDAGLPYSPDSTFVDLWIDGDYFGLYLLTDRIDISQASVDITSLEKATEAVNLEALDTYPMAADTVVKNYADLPMTLRYHQIPNDPRNITGGYLLELDKFYYEDKASLFNTENVWFYTLKSPEYISEAQMRYIHGFITDMEDAICGYGKKHYSEYLDVPSWASMCVIQELLVNGDFMGSSQYFYKDVDRLDGLSLLYAAPVWDMDRTLGAGAEPIPSNVLLMSNQSLVNYLAEDPAFMEAVTETYRQVYRPLALRCLEETIDAYAEQIAASAHMNFTRWSIVLPENCEDPLSEGIGEIKRFLSDRVSLLDDLWLHGKMYHRVHVTRNLEINPTGNYFYLDHAVLHGEPLGQLAPPADKQANRFEGWYYGTPNDPGGPYDPEKPVTEDMYVFAKYSKADP